MLSQKSEKGREKTWQKGNKREGTKDQGSGRCIASFHSLLSNARSMVIHQSLKSLFTDSSHDKFGLPLPLFSISVHLITPLWISASVGLHWICPNHLKRCCKSFSSTGASPSLSCMSSFRTQSLLVWPQIHRSMRISTTPGCWTCRLLLSQHSAPYNMAGRIATVTPRVSNLHD
jgi:hypothetical protein